MDDNADSASTIFDDLPENDALPNIDLDEDPPLRIKRTQRM